MSSPAPRRRRRWAAAVLLLNVAAAALAFALVWTPEVRLYWVGFPSIAADEVLAARRMPATAVLDEIATQYVGIPLIRADELQRDSGKIINLADALLTGKAHPGGYPSAPLAFPFRASNLDVGLPRHQLLVASMASTRILVLAYRTTGEKRYLDAAVAEALAFADVDHWRLVPRGLVWNDHALATRIAVLAELWGQVRGRSDLPDRAARKLLELADRTAARLASPALYTYRTNHGVMQNVALLQFALAFPTLERAGESRTVGCRRLAEQMSFYMDPDGLTLEHSAGYHELGRQLLVLSARLVEQNRCEFPADWRKKLAGAAEFSHLLTRPDRTLPVFGNTDHGPLPADEAVEVSRPPQTDRAVYPAAGFAVWWHGLAAWPDPRPLSQTVVTWSNFPSRAHKLADDMSVVVWAGGRPWLTNTGYWPYGVNGYDDANGWRGSNAPHFPGEARPAAGSTSLVRIGYGTGIKMLEMKRVVAGGASLRRQVLELDGTTWIVIDSAEGTADAAVDRVWTTMPETEVQPLDERAYLLKATDVREVARITFLGDLDAGPAVRTGELAPFAGWVIRSARPTAAPSFEIRQRAPGSAVTVLSIGAASAATAMLEAGSIEARRWSLALRGGPADSQVQRSDDRIVVSSLAGGRRELTLTEIPSGAMDARRAVTDAYEQAARRYPGLKELTDYRYKVSLLMLGLLFAQEVSVAFVRRWSMTAGLALRAAASAAWILLGLWVSLFYLR